MSEQFIQIALPNNRKSEAEWICNFIFGEYLGLPYGICEGSSEEFFILYQNRKISLPNIFLNKPTNSWLSKTTLPKLPLKYWDISSSGLQSRLLDKNIPILFGDSDFILDKFGNGKINLDIFGSVFFILSRYEELIVTNRDKHDRFPATASIAFKAEFIERPIVDEYIEILWSAMKKLWPMLSRKQRNGQILVTCDVDRPYDCDTKSILRTIKTMSGDIIKRRNMKKAAIRIRNYMHSFNGNYNYDPFNTFDWYMDMCDKSNRQAEFFFISKKKYNFYDGCYQIDEPWIIKLLEKISTRGHGIGLHGSYYSYQSDSKIVEERKRLVEACKIASIDNDVRGNRQHYLRWDSKCTPDILNAAGFEYDSSGAYADLSGFRYGTSYPFTMWSWKSNSPLRLKQHPLVLMERTVLSNMYMGLGYTDAAIEKMQLLKKRSLFYGGDFTILWHNSHLKQPQDKELFIEIIK